MMDRHQALIPDERRAHRRCRARAHPRPAGSRSRRRRGARRCSTRCATGLPAAPLRPFQRTVGDEVQGVLDDADDRRRGGRPGPARRRLEHRHRHRRRSSSRSPTRRRAGRGDGVPCGPARRSTRAKSDAAPARASSVPTRTTAAEQLETVLGCGPGSSSGAPTGGWEVARRCSARGCRTPRPAERLGITPVGGHPARPGRRARRRAAGASARHPAAGDLLETPTAAAMTVLVVLLVAVVVLASAAALAAWRYRPRPSRDAVGRGTMAVATAVARLAVVGGARRRPTRRPAARSWLRPVVVVGARRRPGDRDRALAGRPGQQPVRWTRRCRSRCSAAVPGSAVFERAAVFAALVAGWPEGLAVVLGPQGAGPLLRAARPTWRAEREALPGAASRSGSSSARSPACCGPAAAPARYLTLIR